MAKLQFHVAHDQEVKFVDEQGWVVMMVMRNVGKDDAMKWYKVIKVLLCHLKSSVWTYKGFYTKLRIILMGNPIMSRNPEFLANHCSETHHTIVTHLSLLFSTILDASELMKWLNTITSSDRSLAALGTSSSWTEFNWLPCWGTSLPLILVLITTSLFVILESSTV